MTTFDDREKAHELKYAKDEELNFKINARRNKLLGLWAAGKLGKIGADAEAYAKDVVIADFEEAGDGDVVRKLEQDFSAAKLSISASEIESEMERLAPVARQQITGKN